MKWLFAVLVSLNVIVFGSVLTAHIWGKKKVMAIVSLQSKAGSEVLRETPILPKNKPTDLKENTVKLQKVPLKTVEESNKVGVEKENPAKSIIIAQASPRCSTSVTLTLNENSYHRIKGLLKPWPHVATRMVEQHNAVRNNEELPQSYRVLMASNDDVVAVLGMLLAKGFRNSIIYEGNVSVDVVRDNAAAQSLLSRLEAAGFSGARIHKQKDYKMLTDELDKVNMRVIFANVDGSAEQAIQKIVGRYGSLNRECQ